MFLSSNSLTTYNPIHRLWCSNWVFAWIYIFILLDTFFFSEGTGVLVASRQVVRSIVLAPRASYNPLPNHIWFFASPSPMRFCGTDANHYQDSLGAITDHCIILIKLLPGL